MAIVGLIFCLLGLGIMAYNAPRDGVLRGPLMMWAFCIVLVGMLCVLTGIDWT